jgi:hypothetical protein
LRRPPLHHWLGSGSLAAIVLACACLPAAAQGGGDATCAGGLAYDDGSFENAYGLTATAGRRAIVMRLDPQPGALLERVCLCWVRNTFDADLDFELVFYAADGEGGEPGTQLASLEATASAVPSQPPGAFFGYDVSAAEVTAPAGGLFIGAEWDAVQNRGFFLCADQNGPAQQPAFSGAPGDWSDLSSAHPAYRALAIRARLAQAPACVPDDTTLCLRDGRFRVEVDWQTANGATGRGHPVPADSPDAGMFWFFRSSNWELLVKVLDGCPVNQHYWVFAAATTNVGYVLTVTDTASGQSRRYENPLGRTSAAVTDTEALAACP